MLKKILILGTCFVWVWCAAAQAAVIHLTNGKVVEGEIVERSADHVRLNVKGIELTYFSDEIEYIEGEERPAAFSDDSATTLPSQRDTPAPAQPQPFESYQDQPLEPFGAHRKETFSSIEGRSLSGMSKDDLIMTLMDMSGIRDNLVQTFEQIMQDGSPEEAETLKSILDIDEVIAQIVPIYDKYFTREELEDLVAFYRSDVGKKMLRVTPQIMEDSVKASLMYFEQKLKSAQ